ncbi:MAG: ABC transporter ATP-binding protein [Oscillospiraceae bacterium]|nr:ABC transporter ATP-binding protein [Oscillospiraceae bacterium]
MDTLIVKELNKKFDGKDALCDINFEAAGGEFLSILGPSGCGKTTLLRILIGLVRADSGSITLDGRDITNVSPDKREMGIVFQNYALFENMTVQRNVEYAMKFRPELKSGARETANRLIEQVGLTEHANKFPAELSGGQMQRVAIARTLALSPKIILLDEPMSALDAATRLSLREELKRIQTEMHTTMIYITHDQEEAFAMSDRIMVMGEAHIHQIGTPKEILDNPADEYVKSFVIDNLNKKIASLMKYAGGAQ